MIAKIEGTVVDIADKSVVVAVGGVGFLVYVTQDANRSAVRGKQISLYTHLVVREDALDLYGFATKEELDFFTMMISVSGIGPKTGLNILSLSSVGLLKRAIANNDTSSLVKVSGIGKKNAEKIVLELKDKIEMREDERAEYLKDEIDVFEALKILGYSHADANRALREIDKTIVKTSDRIKAALKILNM